jgi:hypothetical protein
MNVMPYGCYGPIDVTNLVNPSATWTAGAMISTVDNSARFYRILLTGRLLPPEQQRELLAAIPVDDPGELFAEHYGLGIYRVQLPAAPRGGTTADTPAASRPSPTPARTVTARPSWSTTISR